MIIYKDNLSKLNKWNDNSIFVLTDFDRTLTSGNSWGSWEIIVNNAKVSNEYKKEVYDLFDYYRPLEINENIDKKIRKQYMIDWWNEEIELFKKYNFDEYIINDALNNLDVMTFRDGAKEFLIDMYNRNIPVIIISAGIGNFIEKFLKDNNCYFNNIYLISNFLKFEKGKLVGFSDKVIHSFNKNLINLPSSVKKLIENRNNVLLLGDSLSDINMANGIDKKNIFSIGFLEDNIINNLKYFQETFDIVATENSSLNDIKIKILKR